MIFQNNFKKIAKKHARKIFYSPSHHLSFSHSAQPSLIVILKLYFNISHLKCRSGVSIAFTHEICGVKCAQCDMIQC